MASRSQTFFMTPFLSTYHKVVRHFLLGQHFSDTYSPLLGDDFSDFNLMMDLPTYKYFDDFVLQE